MSAWSHPDLQRFQSKQQGNINNHQYQGAASPYGGGGPMPPILGSKRERDGDAVDVPMVHPHNSTNISSSVGNDINNKIIAAAQQRGDSIEVGTDDWETKLLQSVRSQEGDMSAARLEIEQLKSRLEALENNLNQRQQSHHSQSDLVHTISAQRAERDEMGSRNQTPDQLRNLLTKMIVAMTVNGGEASTPESIATPSDDGGGLLFPLTESPVSEQGVMDTAMGVGVGGQGHSSRGRVPRIFTQLDSCGDISGSLSTDESLSKNGDAAGYEFMAHASTLVQGLYLPHNTYHAVVTALNDKQHTRDAENSSEAGGGGEPMKTNTDNNNKVPPISAQWDGIYQHTLEFLQAAAPRLSLVMSPTCAGRASLRGGKSQSVAWSTAIEQLVELCCPAVSPSPPQSDISCISAEALQCSVLIVPDFSQSHDDERCVGSLLQHDDHPLYGEHCGDARCPYQHTNQALFVVFCIRESIAALSSAMSRRGGGRVEDGRNPAFSAFKLHAGYGCDALEAAIAAAHSDMQHDIEMDELEVAKITTAISAKLLVLEQCAVWYHAFVIQIYLHDFIFHVVGRELAVARNELGGTSSEMLNELKRIASHYTAKSIITSSGDESEDTTTTSAKHASSTTLLRDGHDYVAVEAFVLSQLQRMQPHYQPLSWDSNPPTDTPIITASSDLHTLFNTSTTPSVEALEVATKMTPMLLPLMYASCPSLLKPVVRLLQHSELHVVFVARFALLWTIAHLSDSCILDIVPHVRLFMEVLEGVYGAVGSANATSTSTLKGSLQEYLLRMCASYLHLDSANHSAAWAGLIITSHEISTSMEGCRLTTELKEGFTSVMQAQVWGSLRSGVAGGSRGGGASAGAVSGLTQTLLTTPTPSNSMSVSNLVERVIASAAARCPNCVAFKHLQVQSRYEQVSTLLRTENVDIAVLETTARQLVDEADTTVGALVEMHNGGVSCEHELSSRITEELITTTVLLYRCLCRLTPRTEDAMAGAVYVCLVGPALGGDLVRVLQDSDPDAAARTKALGIHPLGLMPLQISTRINMVQLASTALRMGGASASMSHLYRVFSESDISDDRSDLVELSRLVGNGSPIYERGSTPTTNHIAKIVLTRTVAAAEHLAQLCGVEAGLVRGSLNSQPLTNEPLVGPHQVRTVISDALLLRMIHDCETGCQTHTNRSNSLPVNLAALQVTLLRRKSAHLCSVPTGFSDALGQFFDRSGGTDANAAYACQMVIFNWFTSGSIPTGMPSTSYAGLITAIAPRNSPNNPQQRTMATTAVALAQSETQIPTLSSAFMTCMLRQHAFPSGWSAGGSPEEAILVALKMLRTFTTKLCSYDIIRDATGHGSSMRHGHVDKYIMKVSDEELIYDLEQCIGLAKLVLDIVRRVPRVQWALRLWDWSMIEMLSSEDHTKVAEAPLRALSHAPTAGFVAHLHSLLEKERSPMLGGPSLFMSQIGAPQQQHQQQPQKPLFHKPTLEDLRRYCMVGSTPTSSIRPSAPVARGACVLESYIQLLLARILNTVTNAGLVVT